MAKHNFELKRRIVMEYLSGQGGHEYLAKKYGVAKSAIRRWIANYGKYGEESLRRRRQHRTYSFEFKLHVVELYLTGEMSYQQLALEVGMSNPTTIVQWVTDYRIAGPEALREKQKGRKRSMDKKNVIQKIEEGEAKEQKELLKQLQEENLRLRIENAFLKEARRLRLEEERLLKEQRGSSTASEENTN